MCAIIDNDVLPQAFSADEAKRTPAGQAFLNWLDKRGRLVIGGQLTRELDATRAFAQWRANAVRYGRVIELNDEEVDARQGQLDASGACTSNDTHIIAIAQISGARLLFSNDLKLRDDFKDTQLIEPRGRVYSTRESTEVRRTHRQLLEKDLCQR